MLPESLKRPLRIARRALLSIAGRDHLYRRDVRLPTSLVGGRPGSGYGEWNVVMDGLGPESVVYSVGIGDDVSFDLDLIRQTGATVHGFDPTPESVAWTEAQDLPDQFVMHAVALAAQDGDVVFYPHENPEWVSHSMVPVQHTSPDAVRVPARRLASLMEELGHDHIDLLKVDIEGAEYDVIEDVLASDVPIRQLLIEFHHRFPEIGLGPTQRAVEALRNAGYKLFTVNSKGEDMGFLRTDGPGASASF